MLRKNYHFKEDSLLEPTIKALSKVHNFSSWSINRHIVLDGKEVDALLYWKTQKGVERRAVIELKLTDIIGVAKQALERRQIAHYTYMSVGLSPHTVMGVLLNKPELLQKLWILGVGIVAFIGDQAVVLVKSRFIPKSVRQLFLDELLSHTQLQDSY